MKKESGFTLIEIIVSLLLVGFMAAFAGTGIVTFTNGYLFAKENAHMAQKANLALARLTREFQELLDVSNASNTAVTIDSESGVRTIGLDDGNIKIAEAGITLADGDILIDDVSGFTLSYWSGELSWAQGMDIKLLSAIQVDFTLIRTDTGAGPQNFTALVHPRNNNNYGGAPPSTEPATQYGYCFLGIAAGGDRIAPSVKFFTALLLAFLLIGLASLSIGPAKKTTRHSSGRRTGPAGSILVSLIMTMLIISALGAAMLPLTSSSIFTQLRSTESIRAYLLAESGLRYAASEYLHADDNDKNDVLENMNGSDCSLLNDDGAFHLDVYPYYFIVTANPNGTAILQTKVPGDYPPELILASGKLKIGSALFNYSNASRTGQNVTFSMTQPLPNVSVDTEVFSVATSSSFVQTITRGGNLSVAPGTADVFPKRNGTFKVNNHLYAYQKNDMANNRLTGIDDPNDASMTAFDVSANSDIELQKFVKIHSTGSYGMGDTASTRRLDFYVPLPTTTEETITFTDTFEDKSNWEASTQGSHEVQEIGGDRALKVTGTSSVAGAPKASLIAFKSSETTVDLAKVYQSTGDDETLSYDAQVKIGFDDTTTPVQGFDPVPIPKYYVAGISFRLDNNTNSYGLSFMRGSNSSPSPYDNIDDSMVPLDDKHLMVLWQQTNNGTSRKWLAYKELANWGFSDDVESGENGWTADGLWHVTGHKYKNDPSNPNAKHSWYYGQEGIWNYNAGDNWGSLVSPTINLCHASTATLSFQNWYETESEGNLTWVNSFDVKYVDVYDGTQWHYGVYQITWPTHPMRTWEQIQIDLTPYVGNAIKIAFRFDTRDASLNTLEGWYIDDVMVTGDFDFPLNEATVLVRVKEAAAISFNNGGSGSGTESVSEGDRIIGQTSGATANVADAPILESGAWDTGNAAGILTLENISGTTFQLGETVYVLGTSITAVVQEYRSKDNYIRAYYSDPDGCGTPSEDPFDDERHAHIRSDELQWPIDDIAEWAADNDYFTLVQWDGINTSVPTVSLIASAEEPDVIIRSDELTSPSSGTFDQPELGLHTFGHGSTNVYFDDFGIQTQILEIGRVSPVQE